MHLLLKVLKVKANSYQVDTTGDPLFYNVIRWRIIMGHGSLFTLFLKKFLWKSSAMKSANGRFQLIIYFNNTLEWFKEIVLDLATRCHTVTRCGFFNVINFQLLDDSFLLFFRWFHPIPYSVSHICLKPNSSKNILNCKKLQDSKFNFSSHQRIGTLTWKDWNSKKIQ